MAGPMDDLLGFGPPPKPPQQVKPEPIPVTAPLPGVDETDTKARLAAAEVNEKSRRKKTQTLLTSAQGVLEQAPVAVKQLFGS